MKKLLPGLLIIVFTLTALIFPQISAAQGGQPPAQQQQPAPAQPGQQAPQQGNNGRTPPPEGLWVADPEVTFIGKNAARSGNLLDWTLRNYNWVCVKQAGSNEINQYQCDDSENPLARFWLLIVSFIVVPMLFVVILATAIVIIVTRGKSLTIMRFLPRFIAVVILIVFSYTLLSFLYQFTDVIQGFFLRSDMTKICPPNCISQKDLLYVGWKYEDFVGLRLLHDYYAESAFISLLLTKLTALTYFVMVGILLMRKIILWFFIIVSPIFPLLLLYYPVRNTGKIWIGEFFRWLLYAPLFAIFLNGLVYMWRQQIPLLFIPPQGASAIGDKSQIIYPTAVNILLGGPKQFVTPDNSVNLTETFALYVVALIMLWVVILLPWILLQIFLDYASNFSPGESAVMKTLVNLAGNKKGAPPGGGGGGIAPAPSGAAIAVPFTKKFHLPTSMGPAGAAKEMVKESATSETATANSSTTRFGTTFLPAAQTAQMNAQVLSVANVSLPTMRDIARFDTAQYTNDTSKQSEVNLARETLEKIANPVAVTNTVEREKYTDIRDKLTQESQAGNILATSILNAANNVITSSANTSSQSSVASQSQQMSSISSQQMQSILQQIANPASVSATSSSSTSATSKSSASNVVNKEKMSQLHEMLSKESKENNNSLAQSLMNVSEKTSSSEIEKIKESLLQAASQGDRMAQNVMSTISNVSKQQAQTQQVKQVLQQVNNPASMSNPVDKQKLTKLQESLSKASKEGNDLASQVLKVTDKTSAADIEKIQEKINQAKLKGEPIATELASLTQAKANVPAVNRVQTVSKEDYDAVRNMWKENYSNLEVPQGMAGNRAEWIKDDIGKIDKIVGLLSSTDKEKVQEGMDEVGGLMPFLLMGGFSQTEIVAYLKAKQDAAKDVAASMAEDEETKVSVSATGAAHAEKAMAVSMDAGASSSAASSASSAGDESESPLANISTTNINTISPTVSDDILAMVDLKLPKMRDVVRYETRSMTKDSSKVADVQKMHTILANISNPAAMTAGPDRERIEQLREKLIEASASGNVTANVILNAAATATKSAAPVQVNVKAVLQQIAAPDTAATEFNKKRFTQLHDRLAEASKNGNELATSILGVNEKTPVEDIQKLSARLEEEQKKGEPLATEVLTSAKTPAAIPQSNTLQEVSKEEFDEVKNLWKENYTNLEVPQGMAGTRADWIKDDVNKIDHTVGLLTSGDPEKVKEGTDEVANILPFLLMGGYSQSEIVSYLKAKQDAGKDVLQSISTEEESKVSVSGKQATEASKTMAVSEPTSSSQDAGDEDSSTTPVVTNEIYKITNLPQPRLRDIARYEAGIVSQDKSKLEEAEKLSDTLRKIADPAPITTDAEREQYQKLKDKLNEESNNGNASAKAILSAATSTGKDASIDENTVPASNAGQAASPEEFEEVKKSWLENYQTLPIPAEFGTDVKGRLEWIKRDMTVIQEMIDLLVSDDPEKKKEGLKKVNSLLPFILLGGFSLPEMVAYLKAKYDAAKEAVAKIEEEENSKVSVDAGNANGEQPKEAAQEEEKKN